MMVGNREGKEMLKLCRIIACPDGTLGLHLSRAPWDPYPWVSGVQDGSSAYLAGVRVGDTVLEINGSDVLGQKISDLAKQIRNHWDNGGSQINFLVWRSKMDQSSINQQSLQKFATCLQNVAQLLECPICLEVVKPPGWQCCNGHVLCNSCRGRTTKCPVCRVTLGPRGRCLLSDKLFTLLAESFPCDVKKDNNKISCPDHKLTASSGTTGTTTTTTTNAPTTINTRPKGYKECKQIVNRKVDLKPEQMTSPVLSVKHKNYHCPTGKSCADQDVENTSKMFSQWDVLTHLQRVHQLSVTQYYGTFGDRMHVELMNKSISCIAIVPDRLAVAAANASPASSMILGAQTLAIERGDGCGIIGGDGVGGGDGGYEIGGILHGNGFSLAKLSTGNSKKSEVELFFVVRIPIVNGEIGGSGDGNVVANGNERCAIFIWYCGNEDDVKKFRAVIECKRFGAKWKGSIHPLTESLSLVQRKKEFLQLKIDVTNFVDIVIKSK